MANITLTNLPTVVSLTGTEPLLGVQSSSSVQITTGQIAKYTLGLVGIGLPVTVPNGGTGQTSFVSNSILIGNGTGPLQVVPPPSGNNYVLVGSAGTTPSWQATIPVTAGVDSVAFGTTGLTPTAATAGVVSVAFGTVPTAAGIYSPATNQIALSTNSTRQLLIDSTGAAAFSGTVTAPFFVANGTITGALSQGAYTYGTLGYSDTSIFQSFASSVNSYNQKVMQNTNAGASASTNIIVSNNLGTANTYFGEFGMNSSGFSGTGAFNAANTVYLDATSADLAIGTTTANAIHFVVNSGATDAATISSAGLLTANSFASSSAAITGGSINSTPIGASTASTGAFTTLSGSTSTTSPLVIGGTTASSTLTLESTSGAGTTDSIIFKTGSQATRMTIDTSGNVGIGTTSPGSLLELFGTSNGMIRFTYSGTRTWAIGNSSTNDGAFRFYDVSASAERMRIDSSGNVGIGTTSPASVSGYNALVVNGTTNGGLIEIQKSGTDQGRIYGTGSAFRIENTSSTPIVFLQNTGTEYMRIDSSGNVSIGGSGTSTGVNLVTNAQITGGTIAYAHLNSGVVQSGVTTQSVSYYSNITSAAASFATGSSVHFYANPATGGAGSTITSQFGFNAESTLGTQGAATITNAYGFFGNIASGTNRWNLYMAGTANNYMAGALGVGTTSVGAAGTITTSSTISDSIGNVRTIVQNSQTSAYTLVATDNGKYISITTGGVTVPASIFTAGQNIVIFNNSGSSQTITQGASVTMNLAGSATTGNRTLAQYGVATVLCTGTNTFVITGQGLT
jgi:hypothetical protein